jgi:hypothetical protein
MGPKVWLDSCAPPAGADEQESDTEGRLLALDGIGGDAATTTIDNAVDGATASATAATLAAVRDFDPHAVVIFDPPALAPELRHALAGGALECPTVGILVGGLPDAADGFDGSCCDRLVSFDTALTGATVGARAVWRAIPPPVSDAFFAEVRPLRGASRAIAIGRSTTHREAVIERAKHRHDLMQVLYGVSGAALVELLREYDVGVYVPPHGGPGFGVQVGMHLAAGQLLVASMLGPTHGLEREIDYLQFDSAEALAHLLERLGRFPEMYFRIRVRGRMKAEHYRASRLMARLVYDLLADVAAFGRA